MRTWEESSMLIHLCWGSEQNIWSYMKMYVYLGSDEERIEIKELESICRCIFCDKNLTKKCETLQSKLLPCLHAACKKCLNASLDKGRIYEIIIAILLKYMYLAIAESLLNTFVYLTQEIHLFIFVCTQTMCI